MQKAADQREVFLPAIKVWRCPPLVSNARNREARANATIKRTPTAAARCTDKYKAEVQKDASEAATLEISETPPSYLAKTGRDRLEGVRIVGAAVRNVSVSH